MVSADVSLTQPYDGGGWGIEAPTAWGTLADSAAGVAKTTELLTAGDMEGIRIFACSAIQQAGGGSPVAHAEIEIPGGTASIGVSDQLTVIGTAPLQVPNFRVIVLGPTHVLNGVHLAGDASCVIRWRLYFYRFPLGASPGL